MDENTQTPVDTNKKEKKVTFGKIMLASGVGTLIVMILIGMFKLMLLFGIIGSVPLTTPRALPNVCVKSSKSRWTRTV